MPFICYTPTRFQAKSERLISIANEIFSEFRQMGLTLTVRQLYYQFVQRNLIPNTIKEYNKLQELVNTARLAGRIDWDAIEDRTRNLQSWPWSWDESDAIKNMAARYREDKWEPQKNHVEVWVEKDALLGVIEMGCRKYMTPYFSCRGYTSQSEVWNSSQRLAELGKPAIILHLGDHDPSGMDMSRDIADRMELFEADNVTVERIALSMDQIREKNPPPNPAKMTDCRAPGYVKKFGMSSWELDALDPQYIINLIESHTETYVNKKEWAKAVKKEAEAKKRLELIAGDFKLAHRFLSNELAVEDFENNYPL